jgi:hypothetical protein
VRQLLGLFERRPGRPLLLVQWVAILAQNVPDAHAHLGLHVHPHHPIDADVAMYQRREYPGKAILLRALQDAGDPRIARAQGACPRHGRVVTQFEIGAHVLTAGCPLNTQAMRAYKQRNSN